ncbi:MAG TPA: hypothetical protein VL282_03240 [Tepidisphaeraceae bacterium]|nr:hypothetical protein [Tepidisphaeraceae bacterium]
MDVTRLSQEDREKLLLAIAERRDYLARLIRWMERTGWYGNDPILNSVRSAYHALHSAVNNIPKPPRKAKCLRDESSDDLPNWMPKARRDY